MEVMSQFIIWSRDAERIKYEPTSHSSEMPLELSFASGTIHFHTQNVTALNNHRYEISFSRVTIQHVAELSFAARAL